VDPHARVVLAGMPGDSWDALDSIYAERGARGAFDAAAVHPYTAKPSGVITIIRLVRHVMAKRHDSHKPIDVTETTWTSAREGDQLPLSAPRFLHPPERHARVRIARGGDARPETNRSRRRCRWLVKAAQ
jgi:hypothetical protein